MADVDIISLWNKGKAGASVETIDVDQVITKKSSTPLYWIRVILWIEFWINVVSLPLIYIYMRELDYALYGVGLPIIIIIYLFYYQFLIQKIKKFDFTDDVRSGIRKLYGYLSFFLMHYKVAIWLSLTFGFFYGSYKAYAEDPSQFEQGGDSVKFWLIMIGVGLVFILIIGSIFHFLIHLIYGRKIKRLKLIVKELDTE